MTGKLNLSLNVNRVFTKFKLVFFNKWNKRGYGENDFTHDRKRTKSTRSME